MSDVTIVIQVDSDRSLKEQLSHLCDEQCGHHILIVDIKDSREIDIIGPVVDDFSGKLNIIRITLPAETTQLQRLIKATENVKTDYVVLIGDGEFVFNEGLYNAARYLDIHKEVVSVQGLSIAAGKEAQGISISPILFPPQNTVNPLARFGQYMISFEHTMNALHRRNVLLQSLTACSSDDTLWPQFIHLAISALIVLQGQTAYIPSLFNVRPLQSNIGFGTDESWGKLIVDPQFSLMLTGWADLIVKGAQQVDPKLDPDAFAIQARKSLYEFLKIPLVPEFRRVSPAMMEQSRNAHELFLSLDKKLPGQENLTAALTRQTNLHQFSKEHSNN